MALKSIAAVLVATFAATGALACGPDTDCIIGARTYRIALPPGEGPYGAIVFMHGYRGTAAGVMANQGLRDLVDTLGVALVAPQSGGEDWLLRNAPRRGLTDNSLELTYFDALLDDVTDRFPVDPSRILASGFSAGGMTTWMLACHRGRRFAGFLPVSGTFWAPIPDECPSPPVDLVHIHGTADTVVPLEGRPIADTSQGDVHEAIALFSEEGGFQPAPDATLDPPEGLACKASRNADGQHLDLCLHDGGHRVEPEWIAFGYETLVPR